MSLKVDAIRMAEHGGPEVLEWTRVELAAPGPGDVLVRHTAIGVNFVDIYHRTGLYPVPLPSGLGVEAAGVVDAVGPGVDLVAVGDRVAYTGGPPGAYAEARILPQHRLVRIPDGITDVEAAAVMTRGMTVEYLIRRTYPVAAGETVLFHAAAGGVGLIAGQWLKALDAVAIGTAGGPEKCRVALEHGYEHAIVYRAQDIVGRVRALTDGTGVPVVYDSIGRDTFASSLDCLRPRGLMVSFGQASGAVPPFAPTLLAEKGSLFLTRPTLNGYHLCRADLEASAGALFEMIGRGRIRVPLHKVYRAGEVAQAHLDLESRRTTGACVLTL